MEKNKAGMKPFISIIVPVYNVEAYLRKCIDSILKQSFTDFELILVDDGSTDSSGEICDVYQQKDGRVIVLHQSNLGVSRARNSGLEICQGEYVTFVDGDDWIDLDTFTLVVHNIIKYNPEIIGFDYQIIQDSQLAEREYLGQQLNRIIEMTRNQACRDFLKGEHFHCGANMKVYKRKILEGIFFHSFTHGEDYIFAWQVFCRVEKVIFINAKKYYYRQRIGSASHDYSERRFSEIKSRKFVYKYTQRYYPELQGYAFEQYYKVILNMGKNFLIRDTRSRTYFYKIQHYVRRYFCRYLMGRRFSIKHKLFSVLLLLPYAIGRLFVPKILRLFVRRDN